MQLLEEFILAYGSRKIVHNGKDSKAKWSGSRKLRVHIFNSMQKAERMNCKWGEGMNSQSVRSYFLQQGSTCNCLTRSLNKALNVGASVQIHKPMGDIFHPIQHSFNLKFKY